jgi:uncharacterized protein
VRRLLPPVLLGGVGVGVYARWVEPRRLRMTEKPLTLPHWPARLDGLRVAVLTDLHAGGPHVGTERVERIVTAVMGRAPDLVVIAGDLVDPSVPGGSRITPDAVARRLAKLRAPAGVAAVLGNHDWRHEGVTVGVALRHAGVPVLDDRAERRTVRGGPLWLAGVGDLTERDPRVGEVLADVPRDEPVLLLSHNPDVFPLVPARVALTIAGHLHGAQVDVPGLRTRVLPSRFGTRFKDGHVVEGGRHLFVSRGIGETGRPLRLGAVPEVPILVLRSAACPS